MPSPLEDFVFQAPPSIPPLDEESPDVPLVEGEVVVFPSPRGRPVELRFAGPFEPFLTLESERVVASSSPDRIRLLSWIGRRLPALYEALDMGRGLVARLTFRGVEVTDVVDLETGAYLDHAGVRRLLADGDVLLPAYAILGPVAGHAELQGRLRGMFASGTLVEVRREESGRVLGRRELRVGR